MPAVPEPARFTACSMTDAMPWRSMSFMVKTWTPESRTATFSRSSRLRMPTSTVCAGTTFGEKLPILDSSDGLGPEKRGERHAVDVARQRRGGRVHVAVRVDPEEADREVLRATSPLGGRRHRAGADAVIAAEHDRQRPFVERCRATSDTPSDRPWRCRGCISCARRAAPAFRESAKAGRPLSSTLQPSEAIRSPRPAMRMADGPMSTPRRPPPRSRGTPMMWTAFIKLEVRS